jgi:hypothetical protein
VEHVLSAEEAAASRRWGRTIVTNVPVGKKGLAVAASEVKAVPGAVAQTFKPKGTLAKVADETIGRTMEEIAKHKDMVAVGMVKLMDQARHPGD